MDHILEDNWIMNYVAGTLNHGERLLVETYFQVSGEGTSRVFEAAEIAGALLDVQPPEEVSIEARDRMLRQLDQPVNRNLDVPQHPSVPNLDEDIDRTLKGHASEIRWTYLGPGLRKKNIWKAPDGAALWLLKAQPGSKIPEHSHTGTELTLVLQGAYRDRSGEYNVADLQEVDEDTKHGLEIVGSEDCICLALTEAPITIDNWPARILQKLVGF